MSQSEHANLTWRKSSTSGNSGGCVEIAISAASVHIRNSRNTGGPELVFLPHEWAAFLTGAKNGEFELLVTPEGG